MSAEFESIRTDPRLDLLRGRGRAAAGGYCNGTVFEGFNAGHWASYAVASGTANAAGDWDGAFPSLNAGAYSVALCRRAGSAPRPPTPRRRARPD